MSNKLIKNDARSKEEVYKIRIKEKSDDDFANIIELDYSDNEFDEIIWLMKKAMKQGYEVYIGIEE